MEGKGKGADSGTKKKRRIAPGLTLFKPSASASGKGKTPMGPEEVVTISEKAPITPTGIPVSAPPVILLGDKTPEGIVVDKPLDTAASVGSEDTEGGVPFYYANPPAIGYDPNQGPITPENGIEFLCSYGHNMLRSRESCLFGKMSTVDRIRQSTGTLWQAMGALLDKEKKYDSIKEVNARLHSKAKNDNALIGSLREKYTEASSSYRRSKAVSRKKHNKVLDYRQRLLRANETITAMKRDLGENAIDRFLASEEGFERDREIFDQAVFDLRAMLGSIYPEFDFSQFDTEVAKAQKERVRPESDPVEDLSLKFNEVDISEGEATEVSSDDEQLAELPGESRDAEKK